jgi:ribosomal protein S18 acetylase RimI-like enzyme
MAPFDFRPAVDADALCLHALATQVFLDTYAPSGIRAALAREVHAQLSPAAFERHLREPAVRITLAEWDAHLVGFAEVRLDTAHSLVGDGACAELTRLYVQSPFLRRGIGRRLLQLAEVAALSGGARTLWLTAWVGNERALAFYTSQGYEQRGSTTYAFEAESFENRLFSKSLRAAT